MAAEPTSQPDAAEPPHHDSAPNCDSYLVIRRDEELVIREVPQRAGGTRYAVDELANPRSITFNPGGVCRDAFVLHGRAATAGASAAAREIFALFRKSLRKHCSKRAAFYVGPHALRLKAEGFRLTLATQTPPTFDLA